MKLHIFASFFVLLLLNQSCRQKDQIQWKIKDNPIVTKWAGDVDPLQPWLKYPRPDMVRNNWVCLNGLWDYAITLKDVKPINWDGQILVPYPVESALSGVKRMLSDKQNLWYRRQFIIPFLWHKKHILLNFEACDWETKVWIDGKVAGNHRGGYDPFSIDITQFLGDRKKHELLISVWDPTDKGTQPRGKQVSSPGSIWYTPSSGIWQSVWIEPVSDSHISSFRTLVDPDNGTLTIKSDVTNPENSSIKVKVFLNGKKVAEASGRADKDVSATVKNPLLWSPDNPVLYDIEIKLISNNRTTDIVKSYTGFRKISLGKTDDGFTRMLLNNQFVWQNGPLDQGFWPDGIYTPPTEEAMVYDLKMIKKMGFNMLRKHVKVENRIFYYWCDKLGILVWQDMPSGDKDIGDKDPDIIKSEESVKQYESELKRMIETKYNHPSIIMWVPFNEGWGQFETERITNLIAGFDPSRLVNSASGWSDRGTGSVNDIHHYPDPAVPPAEDNRAIVLGEFGGLGLAVQGHTWEQKNWGYRNMEDSLQLLAKYETYYENIYKFVKKKGLSATIYTQTTDVETETNGLMTYDRKINKMGAENVYNANHNIIPPSISTPARIFVDTLIVKLSNTRAEGKIYYTTDGSNPDTKSALYNEPVSITQSCTFKAFTVWNDAQSRVSSFDLEKKEKMAAMSETNLKPGLKATVYNGTFTKMPDFNGLKLSLSKTAVSVSNEVAGKDSFYAILFEGFVLIPSDGVYGLFINSDDGSKMIIDNKDTVTNDGVHGMREEGKYYPLSGGLHKIRIEYFQGEGGSGLEFLTDFQGRGKIPVPASWLFH